MKKPNVMDVEDTVIVDAAPEVKDGILDADTPASPENDFKNVCYTGWPHDFYKRHNWARLWDEFLTMPNPKGNGGLKYKTVWAFCKAKFKIQRERELAFEMIGPKPLLEGTQKLRAPWLGDWKKRRSNTFWSDEDPAKLIAIKTALKNGVDQVAAMKAVAPLTVKWMHRAARLAEKVEEAFAGEPFDTRYAPDDPKNVARWKIYTGCLEDARKVEAWAWKEWMTAHAIDPTALQNYLQMAMQSAGQIGAAGALTGVAAAGGQVVATTATGQQLILPEGVTPTHLMLAQSMIKKSEQYDLDLSNLMAADKKDDDEDTAAATRKAH